LGTTFLAELLELGVSEEKGEVFNGIWLESGAEFIQY
jgi:hypothetical protein